MNPTVAALNSLSIFGPHQAGAYREHAANVVSVLGPGIETRVRSYVRDWAGSETSGVLVLTGNAGTGKTALAETWCATATEIELPKEDGLVEVADGRWVVKDLSGVLPGSRDEVVALATRLAAREVNGQLFLCANEGLLRSALHRSDSGELAELLDSALRHGAARSTSRSATVLNMNRQRWTEPELWSALLDHLTRDELWGACADCSGDPCPIAENAAALRRPAPREALRLLVQLASGSTVATLRELLAILSVGITGGLTCEEAAQSPPVDAGFGYFNQLLGGSLGADGVERSSLLQALRETGVGVVADLAVDSWLRDSGNAPDAVLRLASRDGHHARVQLRLGPMTFAELGETLSVSDDVEAVRICLEDFAEGKNALSLWRRRVFFEAQTAIGGREGALRRLTAFPFFADLLELAEALRSGHEPAEERSRLITGLNYLACGFHAYPGRLVIADSASLAARNPGAFRRPDPSVVHHAVPVAEVRLRLEDSDELRGMLDTDDVRVVLEVWMADAPVADLLLTPRLYQAVRESSDYRAPVGADIPEMAELSLFYARLADVEPERGIRVVDPESNVIKELTLPNLTQP